MKIKIKPCQLCFSFIIRMPHQLLVTKSKGQPIMQGKKTFTTNDLKVYKIQSSNKKSRYCQFKGVVNEHKEREREGESDDILWISEPHNKTFPGYIALVLSQVEIFPPGVGEQALALAWLLMWREYLQILKSPEIHFTHQQKKRENFTRKFLLMVVNTPYTYIIY